MLVGATIDTEADMEAAARVIGERFGCSVLVKGGHGLADASDVLFRHGGFRWYRGRRISNPNTHGTGCTLSSAIAANLAKGFGQTSPCCAPRATSVARWPPCWTWARAPAMNHAFDISSKYMLEAPQA